MNQLKYIFYFALVLSITGIISCKSDGDNPDAEIMSPGTRTAEDAILRFPINDDGTIDSNKLAIITFEEEKYDFGTVPEGKIVEYTYRFTNTGKAPLLISHARSTCGCTVPEWPKEPIDPGESGEIKVSFDTSSRPGHQSKPITIIGNTIPNETTLQLMGEVERKE